MNRRGFIGALLGTAAATALPSEIWPFRKIFLPADTRIDMLDMRLWGKAQVGDLTGLAVGGSDMTATGWVGLARSPYPGRLSIKQIQEVEMKSFAEEIPDLLRRHSAIYQLFKREALKAKYLDKAMIVNLYEPPSLLHAPATPENILEFIDELDNLQKQKS